MLKVTFLGTGTSQGVPLIACTCPVCQSSDPADKRLRSSVMIEDEHTRIVIDSGPDFRQQMLRAGVDRIDALVFTHEHKDHIAGMDDIRAFNYVLGKAIDVYAGSRVQQALRREFHYVFSDEKYPGVPELVLHEISGEPFTIGSLRLIPIEVVHYRMLVYGFRIGPFTYITDAKTIAAGEVDKIRGSEAVVLNALRREEHISHFTLGEALAMAAEIASPATYLTHISHQLGLHHEVNAGLPTGVQCAYDGLQLHFT